MDLGHIFLAVEPKGLVSDLDMEAQGMVGIQGDIGF